VTIANSTALWAWTPAGGARLVLRGGDSLDGQTVASFFTLMSAPGLFGQGRSTQGGDVLARVTFTNNQSGLYALTPAGFETVAKGGQNTPVAVPAGALAVFNTTGYGVPIGNSTGGTAFTGYFSGKDVTKSNNFAVFAEIGPVPTAIFRGGDVAPGLAPATINGLSNPVYNAQDDVAAVGSITGVGVMTTNSMVILFKAHDGPAAILAQTGVQPPGAPVRKKLNNLPGACEAIEHAFTLKPEQPQFQRLAAQLREK
jgi:hypothetical protein